MCIKHQEWCKCFLEGTQGSKHQFGNVYHFNKTLPSSVYSLSLVNTNKSTYCILKNLGGRKVRWTRNVGSLKEKKLWRTEVHYPIDGYTYSHREQHSLDTSETQRWALEYREPSVLKE